MPDQPRLCACGLEVPPGRVGAWCSSWCRARADQGLPPQQPPGLVPAGPLAPLERVNLGGGASVDVPRPARVALSLEARVHRDLEAAGVLESYLAGQALDIARRLDEGAPNSVVANLHRELRAIMSDVLRGQDEPGSRVGAYRDDLRARRERRSGGAG